MKSASILLIILITIVTPLIALSQNVLSLSRTQQEVVVNFTNVESVKGMQFIVSSTSNVTLRGIEKGERIGGPDWMLAYHQLTDSTMSVVILNVGTGYLTSDSGTLATIAFEMNNTPQEQVAISLTDVVVGSPNAERLAINVENIGWQVQRAMSFQLAQNFPNPFNPSTRINYTLDGPADVRLTVYDATGKIVRELVRDNQSAGQYAVEWNGTNELGSHVASGTYFSRLTVNGVSTTQKMLLAK